MANPVLLPIAAATLASEDLTCIATGLLIAQGKIGFAEGTAACVLGIVAGDLALYAAGRVAGAALLRQAWVSRWLPPEQVNRSREWLEQRGLTIVFASRFVPGLRLPTYFAAGMLSKHSVTFLIYFLLAAAIWTPLLIGASMILGDTLFTFASRLSGGTSVASATAAIASLFWLARRFATSPNTRTFRATARRWLQWEFWPPWLAYLPLIPYLVLLAIRYRSLTLFTAANPGIESGGLMGESKAMILGHLSQVPGAVPVFSLVPPGLPDVRSQRLRDFMDREALSFPIVLKPDVGERGTAVAVVRSTADAARYFAANPGPTIAQQFVEGHEFGVFYCRYPGSRRGRILSITGKHFPAVIGDGSTTMRDLILNDRRAACLISVYQQSVKRAMTSVPSLGEVIPLTEIGSHCRGAIFLNASHLATPALEETIDRIAQSHPGFFLGRFDIRVPSAGALQEGRDIKVLELNGVGAEPAHIYDPSVSPLSAYSELGRHWKRAFAIGAANRNRGARPMTFVQLISLLTTNPAPLAALIPRPISRPSRRSSLPAISWRASVATSRRAGGPWTPT